MTISIVNHSDKTKLFQPPNSLKITESKMKININNEFLSLFDKKALFHSNDTKIIETHALETSRDSGLRTLVTFLYRYISSKKDVPDGVVITDENYIIISFFVYNRIYSVLLFVQEKFPLESFPLYTRDVDDGIANKTYKYLNEELKEIIK